LQLLWILAASYVFYSWWDWRFSAIMVVSTLANYGVALAIGRSDGAARKRWMITGVVFNLSILGFFKYFNFFLSSAMALADRIDGQVGPHTFLKIALPIGVSFYTFHSINYIVDTFRRKIQPEPSMLKYSVYIAIWPQLVAGPIVRASRLLPQLQTRKRFRWANLHKGFEYIALGLFMKVVLADNLSPIVDHVFSTPKAFSPADGAISVLFFAFQIYGDFAGYSLMAIGFGRVMGFNLGRNFNRPYFSRSFSEFWTRWHISLSKWLRDYLYISLGGNRAGKFNEYRNLMATMVLGGLWHGASWTFVVWGALHGGYLVLQRLFSRPVSKFTTFPRPIAWLGVGLKIFVVFLATCAAWVFFRADSFSKASDVFALLFSGPFQLGKIQNSLDVGIGLVLIAAVVFAEGLVEFGKADKKLRPYKRLRVALSALLLVATAMLGRFAGASFIYFQF
jgi:D-alanyl-lipoteichoic acid acyltransferase DltB (MBOAT superfamily)